MADGAAWKDDFPIAWAEDDLVTRRELAKTLVWVSCASFVASGLLTARAATRSARALPAVKVADLDDLGDLPVGGSRVFSYPVADEPCLLVRTDRDTFVAYSQKCTHLGCPVVYEAEKRQIHCPCHEGFFDVADGRVLAGPPPRPLPRITLERRGQELWAVGREA